MTVKWKQAGWKKSVRDDRPAVILDLYSSPTYFLAHFEERWSMNKQKVSGLNL